MATKRILQAIWEGPFHIGKLSQPVSVGDVLLKVLETIWRAIMVLIALIAATAASLAAWIFVVSPVVYPPLADSIVATVAFDDGTGPPPLYRGIDLAGLQETTFRCSRDYPLKIKLENRSNETVGSVSFVLSARKAGRSDDAVNYGGYRDSSQIIQPDNWWMQCHSLPALNEGFEPRTLEYQIKVSGATSLTEVTN